MQQSYGKRHEKSLGKAQKSIAEGEGLNLGKEFFYLLEKVISLRILLIVLRVTLRNEAISGHHSFDSSLRLLWSKFSTARDNSLFF